MALWKESTPKELFIGETEKPQQVLSSLGLNSGSKEIPEKTESLISAGLTIEGKIEGAGHVRIAGRFKGDIYVEGDLSVEAGAQISGEIRAETVIVRGEVHGNIHAGSRVELLESGVLIGEVKAACVTVAAGSRMRGKVDFGWDEREENKLGASDGDGSNL
jgi:cytoskeletal protein CcmA (bactofilin family)